MTVTTPIERTANGWGALYMVWGRSHDRLLERSIASLKAWHPELPVHVHRVTEEDPQKGPTALLLSKGSMSGISPFEKTLFLDADTIVMGPLRFGFEKAEKFGLACCICECPWAQRYTGLRHEDGLIEYNTGVLFFTQKAAPVMYMWERFSRTVDSSVRYVDHGVEKVMPNNDQAAFAKAVDITGFNPFVLPLNWNFRPKWYRTFYGPVRIWHDSAAPSDELRQLNTYYDNRDAVFLDVNIS